MTKQMMNLDAFKETRKPREIKPFPIPAAELYERYEALSTPMINDVLRENLLIEQALPNAIMPLRDEMTVAGQAFTIKGARSLVIRDDLEERANMLESIPAGSVVIWDTDDDNECAQWGEVMTMAARKRGCRGAVIDGGIRDTKQILAQDFPVFNRFRTSNAMLGRFRITGWQEPIRIGRVNIWPGDIVFGDIDGVIIVPRDMAYDVLLRAEEIAGLESEIKRWIRDGMSAEDVVERGGYF